MDGGNSVDLHERLRRQMRQARAELPRERLERAAEALCQRLTTLDQYHAANRIAAYFAVNGEISLEPLINDALTRGKQVFLPNLDQQTLRFSPYFHIDQWFMVLHECW